MIISVDWLANVDIDAPIQVSSTSISNSGPEPSPGQIDMLADMGFTSAQARKALRETVRDLFNFCGRFFP